MTQTTERQAQLKAEAATKVNFQSRRRVGAAVDSLNMSRDDQNAILNKAGYRWVKRTITAEMFDNFQTTSPTPIELGKVRKGESAWCLLTPRDTLFIAPSRNEINDIVLETILSEITALIELGKSLN